jgi:hypothetical protein
MKYKRLIHFLDKIQILMDLDPRIKKEENIYTLNGRTIADQTELWIADNPQN